MSMFTKWNDISKTVNPLIAGYSDMRIWPLQLVFYTAIVTLIPFVGWVWALVVVSVVAYVLVQISIALIQAHYSEKQMHCSLLMVADFEQERFDNDLNRAVRLRKDVNTIITKEYAFYRPVIKARLAPLLSVIISRVHTSKKNTSVAQNSL